MLERNHRGGTYTFNIRIGYSIRRMAEFDDIKLFEKSD